MTLAPAILAHRAAEEPVPSGLDHTGVRRHISRQLDRHFLEFGLPGPEVGQVHDHMVAVDDGATVRVRVYEPPPRAGGATSDRRPVHVALHGGAWWLGSIDDLVSDATARHRACLGLVVVAVEYRLAPEHPYPAPLHDVLAVLEWLDREAQTLGVAPDQVSIGGSSAGATLGLTAALSGRAPHPLVGLLLEVPVIDLTGESARAEERRHPYPEDLGEAQEALAMYLPDEALRRDPVASPHFATDLSGLPPTAVLTAALDPLHVEAEAFATRLDEAGVLLEHQCYEGALHGSAILTRVWPTARRWHDDTLRLLRRIHRLPAEVGSTTGGGR